VPSISVKNVHRRANIRKSKVVVKKYWNWGVKGENNRGTLAAGGVLQFREKGEFDSKSGLCRRFLEKKTRNRQAVLLCNNRKQGERKKKDEPDLQGEVALGASGELGKYDANGGCSIEITKSQKVDGSSGVSHAKNGMGTGGAEKENC